MRCKQVPVKKKKANVFLASASGDLILLYEVDTFYHWLALNQQLLIWFLGADKLNNS